MKLEVWKRGAKRPRRRERQERCGAVKKGNRKHSSRARPTHVPLRGSTQFRVLGVLFFSYCF